MTKVRAPGLDLLRASAILWVMYSHGQVLGLVPLSNPVATFGWMGVDLFFALSGFLIGGQLFAPISRGEPLRSGAFYIRRGFRTAPAFLVVLALYFTWPTFRERPGLAPLWQYLTFTQNLFVDFAHSKAFSHVWSLCVEEQFYLVAPLVVWSLSGDKFARRAWALIAALVAAGLGLRAFIWLHDLAPLQGSGSAFTFAWIDKLYFATGTRLDSLLAGLSLALTRTFHPEVWRALTRRANTMLALGLVGVGLAVWLFRDQRALVPSVVGYPLLALAMGALVAAGASPHGLIGKWPLPGMNAVAVTSYSLYLSHKAVFHLTLLALGSRSPTSPILVLLVYGASSGLAGAALYWGVERPFLRLRERFTTRPVAPRLQALSAAERL